MIVEKGFVEHLIYAPPVGGPWHVIGTSHRIAMLVDYNCFVTVFTFLKLLLE